MLSSYQQPDWSANPARTLHASTFTGSLPVLYCPPSPNLRYFRLRWGEVQPRPHLSPDFLKTVFGVLRLQSIFRWHVKTTAPNLAPYFFPFA